MHAFSKPGPENTEKTLSLALQAAERQGIKSIVIASNSGASAKKLDKAARELTPSPMPQIIVVTHVCEFSPGVQNDLDASERRSLEGLGMTVITAAHALSGAERSFSNAFGGVHPVEIVAHTLRLFGQGTKVGLEIGMMARDAGAIQPDQPIIAIGGSGRGADTALILTPGTTARLLDSKIHEILCKPALY